MPEGRIWAQLKSGQGKANIYHCEKLLFSLDVSYLGLTCDPLGSNVLG